MVLLLYSVTALVYIYMRVVWSAVFFEIGLRELASVRVEDAVVFAMAQQFRWARLIHYSG